MTNLSTLDSTPKTFFTEPSTKISTKIVKITPDIARLLVDMTDQAVQRKSKQPQIAYLSKQISEGKWQLNGDAVRQDHKGNIIDGLHRLKACVHAGLPIETLFIKGLPTESIKTIDQAGAKRTLADYISIQYSESKYHNSIAASIQAIHLLNIQRYGSALNQGGYSGSNKTIKIDTVYIDKFIAQNPNFFKFVADSLAIRSLGDGLLAPKNFIAIHWELSKISRFKADDFMHKFSTGEGLLKRNPIYAIRSRMIKDKVDGRGRKLTGFQIVSMIFQTWNLYIENKPAQIRFSYKRIPALKRPII